MISNGSESLRRIVGAALPFRSVCKGMSDSGTPKSRFRERLAPLDYAESFVQRLKGGVFSAQFLAQALFNIETNLPYFFFNSPGVLSTIASSSLWKSLSFPETGI